MCSSIKRAEKPVILAISGVKNTGKTTLMEALVRLLSEKGLQVAVIKHDGHTFSADVPGTDTARHLAAGAVGTAVFDSEKYQTVHRKPTDEKELFSLFPEADVILLEGFKSSEWPKIEIVRRETGKGPVCPEKNLLAYYSDLPLQTDLPVFTFWQQRELLRFIIAYIEGGMRR